MNDDMEGVTGKNEKHMPEVLKESVTFKTEQQKPEVANVSRTVSHCPVLVPVSFCPVLGTNAVRCFH